MAQRKFAVWVRSEQQAQTRIVVSDGTNADAAIRQALDQAARVRSCNADTLTIYGIAEGDIADLDGENVRLACDPFDSLQKFFDSRLRKICACAGFERHRNISGPPVTAR
jgi:hypothetical protein